MSSPLPDPGRIALRTALAYAVVAGLWILLSDSVLNALKLPPDVVATIQMYKGWLFVSVSALFIFAILRRQLTAWIHELDQRKKAEKTLAEREEQYRRIVETSEEGIWLIDEHNRTSFANQKMAAMLGWTVEEMTGKVLFDFMDEKGREECERNLARRRQGIRETHEFKFLRKDGTTLWAQLNASPMQDAEGRYLGALAMVTDVTARRQTEEQMRQNQKMNAIGQLAGGIAHDFNNQLAAILGYAELLHSANLDPRLKGYAERISTAAQRSSDLTRKLLTFARKGQNQNISVDVHKLIAETAEILRRSVDRRITLVTRIDASDGLVLGDPSQIQNALLNLGLNARDAMPVGGMLTFSTDVYSHDSDRLPDGQELAPGRYLRVRVKDTGVGMTPNVLSHLFEPFFTTKPTGKGTGMGLASVYGMVKSHQGTISVESTPDCGTEFSLLFPQLCNRPTTAALKDALAGAKPPALRILFAEDETDVRELVLDILKAQGHTVHIATDGGQAIDIYMQDRENIDLVILDMQMPKVSGSEAIAAIRRADPQARIIVSSGYNSEALSLDVNGYLQKPFRQKELLQLIANVMQPSSETDAATK